MRFSIRSKARLAPARRRWTKYILVSWGWRFSFVCYLWLLVVHASCRAVLRKNTPQGSVSDSGRCNDSVAPGRSLEYESCCGY